MEFTLEIDNNTPKEKKRVCCNCGNNIRSGEMSNIQCHCKIDGHYIGYISCFEHWCNRWRKEKR